MQIGVGRRGLAAVALVCHLLTTFGFPLPTPRKKRSDTPYPCQSRPCGCITSDQCWQGDCCCFTLEQKLRWAEENGIEPPEHVRPLVASRKSQPAPPPKKKTSCCSEAEPTPEPAHPPTCCEKSRPAAAACCAEKPSCGAATADCPQCVAKPASKCCEQKAASEPAPSVRWVAGVFAQKCRGEGPAGLFLLDPGIAPDLTPLVLPEPERSVHPAPRSDRAAPMSHRPPTPPPRHV